MPDERTPQQALDEIAQAREQVFRKMDNWPWWYDAGYGAAVGIMVTGAGFHTLVSLLCTAVGLGILAVIVRKWTDMTGVWVNGYKPSRARWVAIGVAGLLIGLMLLSLWLGRLSGISWAPFAFGLLGGILAVIGSRIWTRVYLAETRDLP